MTMRPRPAGLVLLACLSAALAVAFGRLWADPHPLPARTAQATAPSSPEPPLAGSPAAPVPPPQPAPAPAFLASGDLPVPVVAIEVRVPAVVVAGQELEYRICVENRSQAAAHHVTVRNPLPANARFVRANPEPSARVPELVWQFGTLPACACREIVLVLAPTGTDEVKNCARVQFEHGQCVATKIARPALSLRKCGPAQATLYDALTYQLAVTNTGSAPVAGVLLTDTLPEGLEHSSGKNQLTWDIGTLAPGQCREVEYQVVAKVSGRLCNRAVAIAAGGLREQAESCVAVGEAKLTVAKTGPAQRYVNLPAAYQITVSNTGNVPIGNVVLTDPLPPQMGFVQASNGGQLSGNQVQWLIGTLAPGASRTVEVVLRAQTAGRICNRATAAADRGLTAQAEVCTDFLGVSGLFLELVDLDDPVEVGAETSFVITVRNTGTVPATNVRMAALVPEQMAVTRASGPADNRKDGQRILYEPMTLQPGAEARYQIYVKALRAGDVRFKVDLTADQLTSGPVHEEESTTIYANGAPARR